MTAVSFFLDPEINPVLEHQNPFTLGNYLGISILYSFFFFLSPSLFLSQNIFAHTTTTITTKKGEGRGVTSDLKPTQDDAFKKVRG